MPVRQGHHHRSTTEWNHHMHDKRKRRRKQFILFVQLLFYPSKITLATERLAMATNIISIPYKCVMEKNELIGANGKYGRIINIWRCTVKWNGPDRCSRWHAVQCNRERWTGLRGDMRLICRSNGIITILSVSKCQATFSDIYENWYLACVIP